MKCGQRYLGIEYPHPSHCTLDADHGGSHSDGTWCWTHENELHHMYFPNGEKIAAPFESFRQYLDDAVAQLTQEMAAQQISYAIPQTEDITVLLRAVAQAEKRTVWQVWRSWALRHAVPVQWIIDGSDGRELTNSERSVMQKRLRDLLGYVVLGLVLSERIK